MSESEKRRADARSEKAEDAVQRKTKLGVWVAMGGLFVWEMVQSFARPAAKSAARALRSTEAAAIPEKLSPAEREADATPELRQPTTQEAGTTAMVDSRRSPARPEEEGSDRSQDRNLDAGAGVNLARRQRWGTALALSAILLALAGGVAFLVAYWISANNLLLGGTLAVALGGFGAALVLWARWLTIRREAVEPRKPLCPPPEDREAAAGAFLQGAEDIQRRNLLRWVGLGAAGLATATVLSLLRSLGFPSYAALNTRVWKRGQRLMTEDGKPVAANALQPGVTLIVFPEDSIGAERAQTILLRVDQQLLQLPKDRQDWAPMGNLAYSRVCTHAGCTVGMYEKTTHLLMCPCHQSTFDVLRAARPNGGPAARALPQLPLYADNEGNLRAGGGFSEPPGPGFWGMA